LVRALQKLRIKEVSKGIQEIFPVKLMIIRTMKHSNAEFHHSGIKMGIVSSDAMRPYKLEKLVTGTGWEYKAGSL
jgi:hypothetical protein